MQLGKVEQAMNVLRVCSCRDDMQLMCGFHFRQRRHLGGRAFINEVFDLFLFLRQSHITQTGFELLNLLPSPLEYWD